MTALIQHFSIPANNDVEVTLDVDPNADLTSLGDSAIYWRVYEQAFGIPSGDPLIQKSTLDGSIVVLPSPPTMQCKIRIDDTDTVDLLRNYYHETTLIDVANHKSGLNCGIVTITESRNEVP